MFELERKLLENPDIDAAKGNINILEEVTSLKNAFNKFNTLSEIQAMNQAFNYARPPSITPEGLQENKEIGIKTQPDTKVNEKGTPNFKSAKSDRIHQNTTLISKISELSESVRLSDENSGIPYYKPSTSVQQPNIISKRQGLA